MRLYIITKKRTQTNKNVAVLYKSYVVYGSSVYSALNLLNVGKKNNDELEIDLLIIQFPWFKNIVSPRKLLFGILGNHLNPKPGIAFTVHIYNYMFMYITILISIRKYINIAFVEVPLSSRIISFLLFHRVIILNLKRRKRRIRILLND